MPDRDFAQNPFIVIWETTRACQLACRHCRAEAIRHRDPRELRTDEAIGLIDQIAALDHPLFVLTGGDPMERGDLVDLVGHARHQSLVVSITPSATPKVTPERMSALRDAGLAHWAYSIDGSTAEVHDRFRGIRGCFDLTMEQIAQLKELGIPLQVNTTASQFNLADLPRIAELVDQIEAVRWSVFFLIPTGRARLADLLSPQQHEDVLNWLVDLSIRAPFDIKTTEGPQYRRLQAERGGQSGAWLSARRQLGGVSRSVAPVWDGNGMVFVAHDGDVFPSGFLPLRLGNIRERSLAEIYRESPEMQVLRDPDRLLGKCGYCEFRRVCAGSRARAYAVTGNFMESDPFCPYVPDPRRLENAELQGSSRATTGDVIPTLPI